MLDPTAGRELSTFTRIQRDFLLLSISVLFRHGYSDRARILVDAMLAAGDSRQEAYLARAVLQFDDGRWGDTLDTLQMLDRIDPIERFGSYRISPRQRMRRYLKIRCFYELGDVTRVRDAIESYLRQSKSDGE